MDHRWWLTRAAVLCGVYGLVCGIACVRHRSLLYPAPPRETPSRDAVLEWVQGNDGEGETFALCAFAQRPDARTIVHFHGNGEQVASLEQFARSAHERGLGYCAIEYPGYGMLSQRAPSETSIYRAAESTLRQLEQRGVRRSQMVLTGQSLGTGVATEMATRGWGSRLVLLSPYTSIVDVAQRLVVVLPAALIIRDRFDTRSKAPSVRVPVLIVHGAEDTLIPVEMGRGLSRLFPRARFVELAGRGHNDLFADRARPVWPMIIEFAQDRSS
ncbi:MAG: alpha/beta hydrolase [Myxococcales bacterium]|nr:alpha/beta hydrolase [Myxococcales bacterium]